MQPLLLLGPQSARGESSLQSDRIIKIPGSFGGTILGGGYRISTNDALKRFNRDTACLSAGLLGGVIFTALALATLIPERYSKTADFKKQTSQAQSGSLLSAESPTLFSGRDLSATTSTNQVTSGTAAMNDHESAEFSSDERMEAVAGPNPTPVLMLSPAINRLLTQVNRPDFARVIRTRTPQERHKSFGPLRDVDVKTRLIALWHQSLRREKSPGWTLSSNSHKWRQKKIGYTAATSH
ncbi:MAG: hypothetical protein JO076_12710 [Verrucomicrobia bacterium]|nr:hypothetical protein [Verrucomicrobiota bacterium]